MHIDVLPIDHQYVLNRSAKIVGDDNLLKKNLGSHSDFPVIDKYMTEKTQDRNKFNKVTFIYRKKEDESSDIFLVGSFDSLYKKHPLEPVLFNHSPTQFSAITLRIPTNKKFRYKFVVNNTFIVDPLNALVDKNDSGNDWSLFFTDYYTQFITLEKWEVIILKRFIAYILPIKSPEFEKFIQRHQSLFDNQTRSLVSQATFDIGITTYIDKLISYRERHHIVNYKRCLLGIKSTLMSINTYQEPEYMDVYFYKRLYDIMNSNDFSLWNKSTYDNPAYFLKVLRRHIVSGAFSHPRYSGNSNALGWEFISDLLQEDGQNLFDWQQALEQPLGNNLDYIG